MAPLWHVGDRIQQRWDIHRVQRGSMGVLYIVYDHTTHRPYAVKTLQEPLVAWHDAVTERFVKAAQPWIDLGVHANVTQAHVVEHLDDQPLLFLEYVSGGDLRDWIGIPRLTQDLPQVLRFAMQLCDGVQHALAHGMTAHGDIKPGNCLITPDGTLKVTDMGMAAALNGAVPAPDTVSTPSVHRLQPGPGNTGTVAGTCLYMAP